MPEDLDLSEWITTREAAELSGYRPLNIIRIVNKGHVRGVKVGRDWLVNKDDVLAYVEKIEYLGRAKFDPWRTGARQRDEDENEAGEQ